MATFHLKFCTIITLLVLLAACANSTNTTSTNISESQTSTSSVTFTDMPNWQKSVAGDHVVFIPPEQDLQTRVGTIKDATSPTAAAMAFFNKINPDFNRPVESEREMPVNRGWQAIHFVSFKSSPAEKKMLGAILHKLDNTWHIIAVDGALSTFSKRRAQIVQLSESFSAPGYVPEDLAAAPSNKLSEERINRMLEFVKVSANKLSIPGVGLAFYQEGKIIYAGGEGVASIKDNRPVTADTQFMIASNTKGMTTLLLAKLVEMGKLKWDDQVIKHYPDFRLGDEQTTNSVLIKHLVCACTGLPRKDMEWLFTNGPDTPESDTFKELAATQPTSGFGEVFQYNNLMASAAGYVAAHKLYPNLPIGEAYDKAMQDYVFKPLGMSNSHFSIEKAYTGAIAEPHLVTLDGSIGLIEQSATTGFNHTGFSSRPAGQAWSTPNDFIRYVAHEITAGLNLAGQRTFASGPLLERHKPLIKITDQEAYGMGIGTSTMSGVAFIDHGGSMAGYLSNFIAFPDSQVGAIILTNSDEGYRLLEPFKQKLFELLYDTEPKADKMVELAVASQQKYLAELKQELDLPIDPAVRETLAKQYSNPALGQIRLYDENGISYIDAGIWRSPFTTRKNIDGTVSIVMYNSTMNGVDFLIENAGNNTSLTLNDGQHQYVFTELD